jgi:hypothetical protein
MFSEDTLDELMIVTLKEHLYYEATETGSSEEFVDALRVMIEYFGQPGKDYFYETD